MTMGRRLVAEFIGTFLLVFLAVGAAVFGIAATIGKDDAPLNGASALAPASGTLGVAMAFGLVLLVLAYALGPVSGAHVNPAVTLAFVVSKRTPAGDLLPYWVAQFLGAIAGAAVLKLFVSSFGVTDWTGALGSNSYDNGSINMAGAFVLEALLTAAFVGVILLVTERAAAPGFAGIAIGLALTAVHIVGIPLTGTSVNPARSLGPALFAGGTSLSQVWLFIVAPLVGGLLAVAFWALTRTDPDDSAESDEIAGSEREAA